MCVSVYIHKYLSWVRTRRPQEGDRVGLSGCWVWLNPSQRRRDPALVLDAELFVERESPSEQERASGEC